MEQKKSIKNTKKTKIKTIMNKYKNKKKSVSKPKQSDDSIDDYVDDDGIDTDDDPIAVYQSAVYNNQQMVLAKNKKKNKTKIKKKKLKKRESDNGVSYKNDQKLFVNAHERDNKVIKANSKNWDRDWDKIKKQRAEIKRIKTKKKLEKLSKQNSLKKRNEQRTDKIYNDPHSKNNKVIKANSKKWDRDWDKIQKQRA